MTSSLQAPSSLRYYLYLIYYNFGIIKVKDLDHIILIINLGSLYLTSNLIISWIILSSNSFPLPKHL